MTDDLPRFPAITPQTGNMRPKALLCRASFSRSLDETSAPSSQINASGLTTFNGKFR